MIFLASSGFGLSFLALLSLSSPLSMVAARIIAEPSLTVGTCENPACAKSSFAAGGTKNSVAAHVSTHGVLNSCPTL